MNSMKETGAEELDDLLVEKAKETGIKDDSQISGLDGCIVGPFTSKGIQERLKLEVKVVIDAISDKLHLRCLWNIQSLGRRPALEMGFWQLSAAA